MEQIDSPNGLTIYHIGPELSVGPLPSIFYFALSGYDSLNLDPFNQPVKYWEGNPVRVFSFTIPGHGPDLENTKAMYFWAKEFAHDPSFITKFIKKCVENITFLIEQGWCDPEKIGVAGLSRGGFVATHVASQDVRVKAILGFAPLIRLSDLEAFKELKNHAEIMNFNLDSLIPLLTKKRVRFYVGNRDKIIQTEHCFEFVNALADAAFHEGERSPPMEIMISPSIGHKGHGTPSHIFKMGAEWLLSSLNETE